MTREEKLEAYLNHQYMFENGNPEYIHGIKEGVKWADKNPRSPWISVEDRLPEEGTAILEAYTIAVEYQGIKEEKECVVINKYYSGFTCDGKKRNIMGGTT